MSHLACLSLGSNVQPEHHLAVANAALRARFSRVCMSRVYRTPAVGFEGPAFLNAAAVIETDLDVHALDAWLHALEDAHGRDRSGPRYGNRTLDIDIVLFDALVLDGSAPPASGRSRALVLPRPELRHAFVLRPLAEIAPSMHDPVTGRTLSALWADSPERDVPMTAVAIAGVEADRATV